MRSDLPAGIVTFLFTDVEGSTRLLHELGAAAYAEALAEHRRAIREACAAEGGAEVDTQGDAFFFAFGTAPGALRAAAALTEALLSGPIRVRVGIHTGTPLLTAEGYVGDDVHFAARVAATSHGGQVVLSRATRDATGGFELVDLGEHRLKDIEQAVPIYQLGELPFPPLKTISNTNLPRPASSFVGRERELAEVLARIEGGARLLTLTGAGGSGKTRLALEAAAELVPQYKAGVFWVGLASLRDPALVTETIAQTLGAKDSLAAHISERELLLLLDNLEQVIECAPELSALLSACPNLTLLVTSRELLRVQGEVEYPVPPLATQAAVDLFSARSQLEPSDEISELCARLDSLPLAVELAAARTKALTPAQILERLAGRLDLLKGGRDADPRQQTLRATIEWSYDLLPLEEQRLFARLSVFAGGCTLEAAEEVCEADLDTLQSLVEKSLVRFSGERYWMLETIREYGLERLEASDASATRTRHASAILAWSRRANDGLYGGEDMYWANEFEQEKDNVRAALTWLIGNRGPGALDLAGHVASFWEIRGEWTEGRRWAESALGVDRRSGVRRARVLQAAGSFARHQRDWDVARSYLEKALELYRSADELARMASAQVALAQVAAEQARYDEAARWLEDAAMLAGEIDSQRMIALCKGNLADLALRVGDHARAAPLADETLAHYRDVEWTPGVAWALHLRAVALLRAGRDVEALAPAREGLHLASSIGDEETIVWLLVVCGFLAARRGDFEVAANLLGVVDEQARRLSLVLTGVDEELRRELETDLGRACEAGELELRYGHGCTLSAEQGVELALASLD